MRVISSLIFSLVLTLSAQAEVLVIEDHPESCVNEKRIFVREQNISIGPTWVAVCENACRAKGKTVWYPRTVCAGSIITAVSCVPSSEGCNNVEIDTSSSANFNCAENGEGNWGCIDRKVATECAHYKDGKSELKVFTAPTTRAACVLEGRQF